LTIVTASNIANDLERSSLHRNRDVPGSIGLEQRNQAWHDIGLEDRLNSVILDAVPKQLAQAQARFLQNLFIFVLIQKHGERRGRLNELRARKKRVPNAQCTTERSRRTAHKGMGP
jgi:hypothetical protein